jgi:hypothetical protein
MVWLSGNVTYISNLNLKEVPGYMTINRYIATNFTSCPLHMTIPIENRAISTISHVQAMHDVKFVLQKQRPVHAYPSRSLFIKTSFSHHTPVCDVSNYNFIYSVKKVIF